MKIKDGIKLAIGLCIGKELFKVFQIICDDILACQVVKRGYGKDRPIYKAAIGHVKENLPRTYAFYVEKGIITEQ